ncbi:hypothetical protein [Aurantiacibacter spongiae]|uniref:Antifreeze protein n=1 Tax=Aurantiacibacter spongiae TaxID=2488860 RepID=A0A3N5DT78_9SPHN|nr:hypothetical protein [Aurantiacibacter spongiae]RPF72541.1 hypothetical protein EG799_13570 [Aurantiacibacter spongiae]
MRRIVLATGAAVLALSSSLALARGPEDLLPPSFRDPPATPTPSPTPAQTAVPSPSPTPRATSSAVVQQVPRPGSSSSSPSDGGGPSGFSLPPGFPSLSELERMEPDEIDAALGLRPKFDIPPGARRAVAEVGVVADGEGGFPAGSLAGQPAALVRAALRATSGAVVSRWGHIMLRRALASRLDAPEGFDPVDFAAMRARALEAMGEGAVARELVQDVDGSNYNRALTDAAFDAYLATGDILGMCPAARLHSEFRDDGDWTLLQALCSAYLGDVRSADRRLQRALGRGEAPEIDVRLAQRYAGAAGESNRAVNVEWDGVDDLTPWRFALARAVGQDIPEPLIEASSSRFAIADVLIPATPLLQRVRSADRAGERGVLSSAAMVDLYSQLWASDAYEDADKEQAGQLRQAYVAPQPAERLAAMKALWGDNGDYGRRVLTAYAAARYPVGEDMDADAADLIASMLAAGLDRNAMRWSGAVSDGSEAWALLALANPDASGTVDTGDVDDFIDDDSSPQSRKSQFLVAGLAGLGRLAPDDATDFAGRLGVGLSRSSPWSDKIMRAGQLRNQALVALLAGVGMQGTGWERMTARQLYAIVRSLNDAGLSAEARMIAAEAVARG